MPVCRRRSTIAGRERTRTSALARTRQQTPSQNGRQHGTTPEPLTHRRPTDHAATSHRRVRLAYSTRIHTASNRRYTAYRLIGPDLRITLKNQRRFSSNNFIKNQRIMLVGTVGVYCQGLSLIIGGSGLDN